MKFAFIFSTAIAAPSNGIKSQALTWKRMLENEGHEVLLINPWQAYEWQSFQTIVFFNFSQYMADFIRVIHKANSNIYIAPILDPYYSKKTFSLRLRLSCKKLRLGSNFSALYEVRNMVKAFLVRSTFEKDYIISGLGVSESMVRLVPLSYGNEPTKISGIEKEDFCLHISLLADTRKNVKRLVEAAIKYNFKLVLGGKLRDKSEENLLNSWIAGHSNIKYCGFLSNVEMEKLYAKAKVFALPSIFEGVGLVALEAAVRGCNIVITNQGGPKEYYNNLAITVNPNSVDEIGKAVTTFLNGQTFQPALEQHLQKNYNEKKLGHLLLHELTH